MTQRPIDLLISDPLMPYIEDQLNAGFRVVKSKPGDNLDALAKELGPSIRAIATGSINGVSAAMIEALPNLEIIANFGVGYDIVDAACAAKQGVIVTNTPDVLTEEVADTALALLLMTLRELPQAERYLRAGKWPQRPYPLTKATLRDRTVGIFGLGRIGKAIAKRLQAFGTKIVYHGRNKQSDVAYDYYPTLTAMAENCDVLLCVAPGGATTHHAINAEVLAALGADGIVINVGRGSVVDQEALIAALQNGTIMSAGLDVFENEPHVPQALIDMDHVVLLPHVGSASVYTREAMGQLLVDNLTLWFDEGRVLTPVAETPAKTA